MEAHIHKYILAKGPNKRIDIGLLENDELGLYFDVRTKTLIDVKTRHILKTNVLYSVETLVIIHELLSEILKDPAIKNKVLLRELANVRKFSAEESIVFTKEPPKKVKKNASKNRNKENSNSKTP